MLCDSRDGRGNWWVLGMGEMTSQSELGGGTDGGEQIEEASGRIGNGVISNFSIGVDVFCSRLVRFHSRQ